jgi:hypothetical protein
VSEQVDQLSALAVAEAGQGFSGGDAGVREGAVGLGRADPGHDKQQLADLRVRRACWWVDDDLGQLDLAGSEFSFQARSLAADLVGFGERAQPLLE